MREFFFICFGVGAGFVLISFLLGELLGAFGFGGDGDFDGDIGDAGDVGDFDTDIGGAGEIGTDFDSDIGFDGDINPDVHLDIGGGNMDLSGDGGDFAGLSPSPLKPRVIAAGLTVFGGVGLLLYDKLHITAVVGCALLTGAACVYALYNFVMKPLYKLQNTSTVSKQSLIGRNAKVTETIFQGGFGKITYVVNGNTYTAPAKAENGGGIARGTAVEIVYIVRNAYYVREKGGK